MKNVLIVEDSKAIRSVIRIALEEAGDFFAAEANNGFEALKMLPSRRFDLIITDINMPDINGLELISYLRNNANYLSIPVFIISTEGSQQDIEKGRRLGANEYLTKPFDPTRLQALITTYLCTTP